MQITSAIPKLELEATVEKNLGADLDEAIGLFGVEAVFAAYERQAVIALQAFVRRKISKKDGDSMVATGISQEDLQKAVTEWKLGVVQRAAGVPKKEKIKDMFGKLSAAEQLELLKDLRSGDTESVEE